MSSIAWCVFLVHLKGGGCTCVRSTPEAAKAAARAKSERHLGSYVACTLPYVVHRVPGTSMYDTTHPTT